MKRQGYLAVILDEFSRRLLLSFAKYNQRFATHMTVAYEPDEISWRNYLPLIESEITLRVIGLVEDGVGQTVLVDGFQSEKKVSHITISTKGKIPARYCEDLAILMKDQADNKINGTVLKGKLKFIPHRQHR